MRYISLIFLLWTSIGLAQSAKTVYLSNERFAVQIGDIEPIQWKDYEPIQRNVYKCMDDKKLDTPVCKRVQERMSYALYDALSQAHVLNTLAKSGEPRFCDKHGEKVILDKKFGSVVAYAMLIVDERLKYGSSLYGDALSATYLGKIVHDSLIESLPCKP